MSGLNFVNNTSVALGDLSSMNTSLVGSKQGYIKGRLKKSNQSSMTNVTKSTTNFPKAVSAVNRTRLFL